MVVEAVDEEEVVELVDGEMLVDGVKDCVGVKVAMMVTVELTESVSCVGEGWDVCDVWCVTVPTMLGVKTVVKDAVKLALRVIGEAEVDSVDRGLPLACTEGDTEIERETVPVPGCEPLTLALALAVPGQCDGDVVTERVMLGVEHCVPLAKTVDDWPKVGEPVPVIDTVGV